MLARRLFAALGAFALAALPAGVAWAQGAENAWPPTAAEFVRGTGNYLSPWRLGAVWLLFLLWVATTDWLSRDAGETKQKLPLWNGVAVGAFLAGLMLLFEIPWFYLGYSLLLVAYAAPLGAYLYVRDKSLPFEQRICTRPSARRMLSELVGKLGLKFAAEGTDPRDAGPPVKFTPLGGATDRDNSANMLKARNLPGYVASRELIHDLVKQRVDGILLDYGRERVAVRRQIDGVWHNAPQQEREKADPVLAVFKTLMALNPADRRSRQSGKMGVETNGAKFDCTFNSQGTDAGERATIHLTNKKLSFTTLEDLGMRPKVIEQLLEILRAKKGFVLFSATPQGGLSTLTDVTLGVCDKFVRNFVAVEDASKLERDVMNIAVTTYKPPGETPATVLPPLIRTYPDVFVVREMVNAETATILCDQVNREERYVFSTIRAKEAVEALLRVLMLKVPPAEFAKAATAVVNGRLLRKLCEKCKEPYAPSAEMVKQYGLPPKLQALYRTPTKPIDPKHPEKKCEACGGIGYQGRSGFYELLIVNDMMRQILVKKPQLDLLRDAARKAGHRTLQEEGMVLVAKGITSVQELSRVLKG